MEDHDDPNIINNMNQITHDCVDLELTGNLKVTYKVFWINIGGVINRMKIIPTIVPDWFIMKVNESCKKNPYEK